MPRFIRYFSLFSFSLFSTLSIANPKYITENLYTYYRTGASDQYRIAGTMMAGSPITVLAEKGKYSLVRDERQREGWILTKDISTTPSSKIENPQLKAQIEDLTLKLNTIDDSWKERVKEMERRTAQAENQSSMLLEENTNLKREMDMIANKNRNLEAMLDANKQAIAIQWFIYGGSVLGVGLLLGLILPRLFPQRRRRPGTWA